jgi:transposase
VCATQRDEGQRVPFRDLSQTLPVPRVVVVDESGFRLGLCPARARAAPGQRAFCRHPFRYGKSYSLLASLRAGGTTSRLVEGTVNRARFEAYITECLAPTLRPGDIVLFDNVAFHASPLVESFLHALGVSSLRLPTYSPDLSPIEAAFCKLKAIVRRLGAATFDALTKAVAVGLRAISVTDALAWFIHCGYLNIDQPT